MKKLLMAFLMIAAFATSTAMATEEGVISREDFEKYDTTMVFNPSGSKTEFTISYPGMANATGTLGNVIVNGPGSMHEKHYEGNAAENLMLYAQTSENELVAIMGGLNNGWRGMYSHPATSLTGSGGADASYNAWNRRCSVIDEGGNQVLQISIPVNGWVVPKVYYGYEKVDLSRPVIWESDINLKQVSAATGFQLSLTNGKYANSVPFEPFMALGAEAQVTAVDFKGDKTIEFFGQKIGDYSTNKYYTVSVRLDTVEADVYASVTIKDRTANTVVATSEAVLVEGINGEKTTGVLYSGGVNPGSSVMTELYIDNINLYHLIFTANLASNSVSNVGFDGTGRCMIEFNDNINFDTLTDDKVKVYEGETLIEGTSVKKYGTNASKALLSLPELKPQTEYRVVISGVAATSGLVAEKELVFTTKDLVTLSNVSKTFEKATFKIKNNAAKESSVTVMAVCSKEGKILPDGVVVKRINLEASKQVSESLDILAQDADEMEIFVVDSFGTFRAETNGF